MNVSRVVMQCKEAAERVASHVTFVRRFLHQIPEIRWQEEKTLEFIHSRVEESLAFFGRDQASVRSLPGGLVVDINIDPTMPRRLLRADVDALPITEATGLPFASQNAGKMHACGHDAHSAMLLGALRAICCGGIVPTANLRFVWQRAEENPLSESGGASLVREGVCDGIDSVHGLHIHPMVPTGTFLSRPGGMMANSDRLKVAITCSGGHVMNPESGSNAIDIAVDVCQALKGFALRKLGPLEPVSLVPAQFNSGTASNVRPNSAELWFAVRTLLNKAQRELFHGVLITQIKRVAEQYPDAEVEVTPVHGHPALANDPGSYTQVKALLDEAGETTAVVDPILGGEDFAHYLNRVPGSFWMLGAHQDGTGDFHTPTFNPNEDAFTNGVLYWLLLATM